MAAPLCYECSQGRGPNEHHALSCPHYTDPVAHLRTLAREHATELNRLATELDRRA